MKPIIADIHTHSTLRLFYGNHSIMWNEKQPDSARDKNIFTLPQAVFSELLNSRVRLIFLSLYAIEQGFLGNLLPADELEKEIQLGNGKLEKKVIKIIDDIINKNEFGNNLRRYLASRIDGIASDKYSEIVSENADYFVKLNEEYRYLISEIEKSNEARKKLLIAGNFDEVKQALHLDDNLDCHSEPEGIVIVLTIEGGHCLGCGMSKVNKFTLADLNDVQNGNFRHPGVQKLYEQLKENVAALKKWGGGRHCPLFITFAHHFWNQLSGHNMSIPGIMSLLFDQNQGMNTPVTELGKKIISELLSDENGRRILIDTKHMSVDAKRWYYAYVKDYNLTHPQSPIPIISSHSAVNGWKTMEESRNSNDHKAMNERYKNIELTPTAGLFNNWDINLSDEEINFIHRTGGIIGINFDQRILSGPQMLSFIEKHTLKENRILFRSVWAEPIIANILHIAKVVYEGNNPDKDSVWDIIAIGSDFDGMINPLDAYCYASDFELLRETLLEKLEVRKPVEPLLENKDITQLVDGFMYKNALKFLRKHFRE